MNFFGHTSPKAAFVQNPSGGMFLFKYLIKFPAESVVGGGSGVAGEASPDYLTSGPLAVFNALRLGEGRWGATLTSSAQTFRWYI
jgi:hypothetical protein